MMVDQLVQSIDVSRWLIIVKFDKSIIPNSLKNDGAIKFYTEEATPVDESSRIRTIDLEDDYDSFRDELTLYFEDPPETSGNFRLEFNSIVTVAGNVQPSEYHVINYPFENEGVQPPAPVDPSPTIVDKSIPKNLPYTDRTGGTGGEASLGNPVLLDVDHDSYIITIDMGNPDYVLDSSHFILEKKKVSLDFEKWSEVGITNVTDDGAGTVTIETTEFDTQHKYRVRIAKEANNGTAAELTFVTDITPVIGDPEHVMMPLPAEVTEVETIQAMYRASVWALGALKLEITDDLPFIAYEYVATAAQCELSKTYGLQVKVAPNQTVRLGDLSVTSGNRSDSGSISRGTATDVCELAYALRQEVIRSAASANKAFHKGGKVMDRLPNRAPKSIRAKPRRRSIERF